MHSTAFDTSLNNGVGAQSVPYRAFERANIGLFFETASISRFFVVFSAVSAGFGAAWAAVPRQIGLCLASGRRGCRRAGGGVRFPVGGVVFPVGGTGFPIGGTGFPVGGVVADCGGGVSKKYILKNSFLPGHRRSRPPARVMGPFFYVRKRNFLLSFSLLFTLFLFVLKGVLICVLKCFWCAKETACVSAG